MKRLLSTVLFLAFALFLVTNSANAETFTQTAVKDTTFAGNPGKILFFDETGGQEDVALFVENDLWRIYAFRPLGGAWEIEPAPVYYMPDSAISVGQTWSFPKEGSGGGTTTAEVIRMESVSVPAGTWANAYRIEIRDTTLGPTSQLLEVTWVVQGVGVVKANGFLPTGEEEWLDELESYSVSGSGYFPMDIGNTWTFRIADIGVPVSLMNLGGLKAMFDQR